MSIRCLFGKHSPVLVIDALKLANGFTWGECFSYGAVIEESHTEYKRCKRRME